MRVQPFLLLMAVAVVAIAACSGGSKSPQLALPLTQPSGGAGYSQPLTAAVNFSLIVPAVAATQAHARRPADTVYVSPDTASISIQIASVNGQSLASPPAPTIVAVPSSCIGGAGCTIPISGVPAAIGSDTFIITTYAATPPPSNVLSTGIVNVTVATQSGVTQPIGGPTQLSLGGYVESIGLALVPPPGGFAGGTPSNGSVVVTALDAGGAAIVGNVQFANPIVVGSTGSLTLTGPLVANGTVTLSGPPSAAIPVAFDGTGPPGGITAQSVDASGAAISAAVGATIAPAPPPTPGPTPTPAPTQPPPPTAPPTLPPTPTPAPSYAPVLASVPSLTFANATAPAQMFTVSQAGYAGPFTVTSSVPAIATATIAGATVTVTPVAGAGAGQTQIVVTGTGGQTVSVPVAVGASPIVVTPSQLSFTGTGAAAAQTLSVAQLGYTGTFGVSVVNGAVASAVINGTTVTVTPIGAGTTTVTVSDNDGVAFGGITGLSASITVTVTTSIGTIQ